MVCSGAKSLLDVPATLERLESSGVPVIGYGTDSFPLFYQRESDLPLADRSDDPATVARVAATHWGFARTTGVLVANPIAEDAALAGDEVEPWIEQALAEAEAERGDGVGGHALRARASSTSAATGGRSRPTRG